MADLPVADLVKVLSRCEGALEDRHLAKQICILEAAKAVMRDQVVAFFDEAGSLPVLVSYASDGTPLKSRHRVKFTTPDRKKAFKSGAKGVDVLAQHVFLRYFDLAGV